eukprot:CAMPEP_0178446104 /NCGR_PEP_ID=MMETSP0689_2-20121128/40595_1 /TAXON_ID=160604 /ORGANISM="Amphidinium massartii, Strain CS-259" /LENGTH=350 /DNA_ID=CAMNT_0020070845 /DNA_START=116 /DNA_END=1165 /DNA_ORIENTATION=-
MGFQHCAVVLRRLAVLSAAYSIARSDAILAGSYGKGASVAHEAQSSEAFHFDYAKHGADWTMGECSARGRQSPIDIDASCPWLCASGEAPTDCMKAPLLFNYWGIQDSFSIQNNGHSLAVDLAQQGYGEVWYDNGEFDIVGINFHTPSEHTINGKRFPLEAHIVHRRSDAEHAVVVAVLFDDASPGGHSVALSGILAGELPGVGKSITTPLDAPTDLLTPFLQGGVFFEYQGSLTAPPCTEQVTWLVRSAPLAASAQQIEVVRQVIFQATGGTGNWRGIMPRMERPVSVRMASPGNPPPTSTVGAASAPPTGGVAPFQADSIAAAALRGAQSVSQATQMWSTLPDVAQAQ